MNAGCAGKTVRSLKSAIPERLRGVSRQGAIQSTFTLPYRVFKLGGM